MTDEEKMELVRRCTYLIRIYGRDVISQRTQRPQEGVRRYEVQGVVIQTRSANEADYGRRATGNERSEVTKGVLSLFVEHRIVFSVPHRKIVRPSVLREFYWPGPDFFADQALGILRQQMALDDLAGVME